MREANLEVAQSKTELLAVLREHKAAVGSAVERNRSRNPRVYGPDYGGNERSVAIIVDVDADVDYNDLSDIGYEIEQATGYKVVVNPSDIVDQSPPGHPIREAVAL
jgi:hypothetical protein